MSSSSSSDSSDDDSIVLSGPRRVVVKRRRDSFDSHTIDDIEWRRLELDRIQEQREFEEGLEQLYAILSMLLLPILGKYVGRRWAHSLHQRYIRVGLNFEFFMGARLARFFTSR